MGAVVVLAGLALTAVAVFVTFAAVALVFKILFKGRFSSSRDLRRSLRSALPSSSRCCLS